jgi:hypothetical protein
MKKNRVEPSESPTKNFHKPESMSGGNPLELAQAPGFEPSSGTERMNLAAGTKEGTMNFTRQRDEWMNSSRPPLLLLFFFSLSVFSVVPLLFSSLNCSALRCVLSFSRGETRDRDRVVALLGAGVLRCSPRHCALLVAVPLGPGAIVIT